MCGGRSIRRFLAILHSSLVNIYIYCFCSGPSSDGRQTDCAVHLPHFLAGFPREIQTIIPEVCTECSTTPSNPTPRDTRNRVKYRHRHNEAYKITASSSERPSWMGGIHYLPRPCDFAANILLLRFPAANLC